MTSSKPLQNGELIDCAKANANQDIETVSELCGYGKDISVFEQELKKAFKSIGLEIDGFKELKEDKRYPGKGKNIVIAPESPNQF